MTATINATAAAPQRVALTRGYRFELVKLLSLWRVRLLLVASWLGPAVVVVAAAKQGMTPSDTVSGRWLHATVIAGAALVLSLRFDIPPIEVLGLAALAGALWRIPE